MDEEPQRRIEDLAIYIPFIDYLLSCDREKHLKLEKIKQWILEKKRYTSDVVKTMEQSIFTQYKNQLSEDVKVPKEFLRLFNRTSGVKYSTVNLCSDDDSDGDGDDDDDDDVVCISFTVPQSNESGKKDSENSPSVCKEEKPCTSSSIVRAIKDSESSLNLNKEEKPCKSSLIARDNKSSEKQETVKSAQNDKDKVVSVTTSLNVPENKVHNISSNLSDGEIVDSDDVSVIQNEPSPQIVISDKDDNTVGTRKNQNERKKRKRCRRKRKNKIESENQTLFKTSESQNQNKVTSTPETVPPDDDDNVELLRRIEKIYTLSDQSNNGSDTDDFYDNFSDLDNFKSVNKDKKPNDILTDEEITKQELFTRRPKKVETSQNDELGYNTKIEPEISSNDVDCSSKIEGVANKLEDMDISELDTVLKKLTSNNNFDLEQFLAQLVDQTQIGNSNYNAGFQNLPTQTISSRDRNLHVPSISQEILSPKDNFTVQQPSNCSFKESFIPPQQNYSPKESFISTLSNCETNESVVPPPSRCSPVESCNSLQNPLAQQFPIVQPIPHQNRMPDNTSTLFHNGRKLNLNDPRIMRQLKILKNSPINSTIREMATNLYTHTAHTQCQPIPKPATPKAATTYGEYKRLKAERKKEAERRKEEVARAKEAEKRKEAERLADEKKAAERLAEEKRTSERLAEEKRVAERLAEEERAAERLAEEKRAVERLAEEKRAAERLAEEKRAAERLAEEKRAAEQTNEIRQILRDNPKRNIESIIISEPPTKSDLTNKQSKQIEVCRRVDNNKDSKTVHSSFTTAVTYKGEKNNSSTPKTPKKVGRKPGVRKKFFYTVPKPIVTTSSNKGQELNSASSKLLKKLGRKPDICKTSRVLKALECTVIGFNEFKDFIPSVNGKRLSSEHARNAISKQLSSHGHAAQYDDSTDNDLNNKKSNEPPKRQNSFSSEQKQPSFTATPVQSRRKSYAEFDDPIFKAAPISSRRKTCTDSLDVDRSSSPIIEDVVYLSDSNEPILGTGHQEINIVDITSSSDTDTMDLTEFKREKQQRDKEKKKKKLEDQKKLMIKNQPVVRLLHYSSEKLEKLLNRTKSEEKNILPAKEDVLNVQLVQSACEKTMKPECSSKKYTKLTKQIKNILSGMTERNTRYCVLCKSKPSDLVNHYVRSHKCEPYVARLSEDELRDLQINWPSAIPCASNAENPRVLKYKIKCLFCEDELIDSFNNFYNHFSTHTGEYGFQCENCKLQKPFRADIQSHKHHSKSCRNARIQTMYVYPPNLMAIYLHCCTICNFVQLNEANVHKHLREHHDQSTSNNSDLVQKYIAAAINDAEIVNEASQENELLEDEEMEEMPSQIRNISECKQEFDLEEEAVLNASEKNNTSSVAAFTAASMTTIHNAKNIDDTIATAEEIPRPTIVKIEPMEQKIKKETEVEAEKTLSVTETRTLSHTLQSQICEKNQPHLCYRLYYPDTPYFGLFKCMATDCLYSTNESDEMLTHLNDHSTSEYPPIGYLDCSYCMLQPNQCITPEALVAHVREKHNYSCFQCPKCCYRSCIPGNIIIHKRTAHFDDDSVVCEFVYECKGPKIKINERLPEMIHSMEQNVPKLPCKYCFQGFYAVSNLAKHLQERHKAHEDSFEEFACIYCGRNATKKEEMQLHLAIKHPDELAYTCLRILKDVQKEDVASNLFLCDIREDISPGNIRQTDVQAYEILTPANVIVNNQYTTTNFNIHNDNGGEVVPESIDEPQDLKPSFAQLEQIAVDSLGSLLNKLTSKTGLPPDILYQCAETTCRGFFSNHELWSRHMISRHNCWLASCPHCLDKKEFTVSEFMQHFEEHCRHLYVCFHCGMTFVNKAAIVGHFQLVHNTDNATETRFETVKFNIRYSYHIIINAKLYPERLEFLEALRAIIIKRLDQLATEEKSRLLNKWIVPLTADWLDNFPIYTNTRHCLKRCLDKNCTYKSSCENELALHLRSTHSINSMRFQCSKCSYHISKCNNWDQILDHFAMHKSNIYACCVCGFYHFKRANLIAHIKNEHNSRDAPFISLDRSVEGTHVSPGVVFKPGMKILSTTRTCFFCTSTDVVSETYIKHLKKMHSVYLKYHCELCLTPIDHLMDIDEHFKSKHKGTQITISCEFLSDGQVEVRNIVPLELNAVNSSASSVAKRCFDNDDSNLCQDNKRLKISCSKITDIKKELVDDDDGNNTDSSVELLENDEIVCAAEFNTYRNESHVAAAPKIKIKNLTELSNNDFLSIAPIQANIAPDHGIQLKNVSETMPKSFSPSLPLNIAPASRMQLKNVSEILPKSFSPSLPLNIAPASGIQFKNTSEISNNKLPNSANNIQISLLKNTRTNPLLGSIIITTTAATTTTTTTNTSSTQPFSPKRFRRIVPKIVPISSTQALQMLNHPQTQVAIQPTSLVPQANQTSTTITNGNSLQQQSKQIYSNDQAIQRNLTNISNNQPSVIQQALALPQQPPTVSPLARLTLSNKSKELNQFQLTRNLTKNPILTGTEIPNITWIPAQQPK